MLYHKIYAPWKRDPKSHKLTLEPVDDTSKMMINSGWLFDWTEKIDGTNIRVFWDGHEVMIGGRTPAATLPPHLIKFLELKFPEELFEEHYGDKPIRLFGEGIGPKIQHSDKYNEEPKGYHSFMLFDVFIPTDSHPIGGWWLNQEAVASTAATTGCREAVFVETANLLDMRSAIEDGYKSNYGDFVAEGLVGRPDGGIFNRKGERVIYKLKGVDFE